VETCGRMMRRLSSCGEVWRDDEEAELMWRSVEG